MFFWMMLASLMGIVAFGNLREKTKEQEDFIAPVYQAMALSAYQQHIAAEQGFLDAMRISADAARNYMNLFPTGVVPLVTVENSTMSPVDGNNVFFKYMESHLPLGYKAQNNTRTYLFCIPKNQDDLEYEGLCLAENTVKYIATIRQIPRRYDGADKMTALKAISYSTAHSRFIGLLSKKETPLMQDTDGHVTHQPIGAHYYILSSGIAPVNSVYVPNHIICKFPMKDLAEEDPIVLGNMSTNGAEDGPLILQNRSFIISLSLIAGLKPGENLDLPSTPVSCSAIPEAPSLGE